MSVLTLVEFDESVSTILHSGLDSLSVCLNNVAIASIEPHKSAKIWNVPYLLEQILEEAHFHVFEGCVQLISRKYSIEILDETVELFAVTSALGSTDPTSPIRTMQ